MDIKSHNNDEIEDLEHVGFDETSTKKGHNYTKEWSYDKNGESIVLQYTTLDYNRRTVIATYTSKRATKDRKDREEKLKKTEKLLQNH